VRLLRLEIEDFALIARAELTFSDGFTVCTGETGSGKTMLLGALAFVLGERSSTDVVRAGGRARVTLEVDVDDALRARLQEAGFDAEDGAAIFARELNAAGKSTSRINGRLATSAQVRELGEALVERIGQHEQQRLLSRAYQRELLDAFAGPEALALRTEVLRAYEQSLQLESELRELNDDTARALAELEFARFAAAEIDAAALVDAEDEIARERRDYLANVERIEAVLARAHDALSGEGAAIEALGSAAGALAGIARYAPELAALAASLAALQSEASEAAVAVARERDRSEFDPNELEALTARLDLIERLKKKYGGSIASVAAARERFTETIARESSRDERSAELREKLAAARATLARAGAALGSLRAGAARLLEARVGFELAGLAMPAARFGVLLEPLPEAGPSGAESVEFALAPNAGEPLRPLARAASGGELSRVLLAIVVVLAAERDRTALVFDEIDAGVGGATATAVGLRIGALARVAQILCVTHLAQIAVWADRTYALRKREAQGTTVIEVVALEDERSVLEEIARMLSGSAAGVAIEHAQSLVREARALRITAAGGS
jgi:DNA repair protein RecN (Recombination protein N)